MEFVFSPCAQLAIKENDGLGHFVADRIVLPNDVVGFQIVANTFNGEWTALFGRVLVGVQFELYARVECLQ